MNSRHDMVRGPGGGVRRHRGPLRGLDGWRRRLHRGADEWRQRRLRGLDARHHSFLAALLLAALAPASTRAQCTFTTLPSGVVFGDNVSPHRFSLQPANSRWTAVALRPLGGDWDLAVYGSTGPAPSCVSGQLAFSNRSFGVDVVVGDFNHMPTATRYPVATRGAGSVGYQIEFDEAKLLFPNGAWEVHNVGSTDIMDAWDIQLEADVPYHFNFVNNGDCRMLLFRNPSAAPYWAGRGSALADLLGNFILTPIATEHYAVLVINETGAAGSYALRVAACVPGDVHQLGKGILNEAVPSLSYYSFTPTTPAWSAVGLRDAVTDWDLYVAESLGTSNYPGCNTNPLAASVTSNRTEFVVGDFNAGANPLRQTFVTIDQGAGSSSGVLKWAGDGERIVVGEPALQRNTSNVIEAWDVQLTAGQQYTIDFSRNGTDAQFYLFRNPGGPFWGTRADAALTGNQATLYTAPSTGAYGLVVVHDNSDDDSYAVGVCAGNLPSLTSGIVAPATASASYRVRQLRAYWAAAGVRSTVADWDIELRRGACDAGDRVAASMTPDKVDFVIGDFNHSPMGDYSVRAARVTGTAGAVVEWDDGGDQIYPGMTPITRSTGGNDVLEVWDVFLTAGKTYNIYFARDGAAETSLLLFQSHGVATFAIRGDAALETRAINTRFTPDMSDDYGLVVVNDNGASGHYALGVASSVTDVETADLSKTALRGLAPNPTRGRLRIDYTSKEGGAARVEIVDVAGRIVASRSAPASLSGASQIEWDGLDARGRRAPAGIYWARLCVAGHAIGTRKFVVVR